MRRRAILEVETRIARRAVAARQGARARPHLQPAHACRARAAGARVLLGDAARHRRRRCAAAVHRARAGRGAGTREAVPRRAGGYLAAVLQVSLRGEQRGGAAAGRGRRGLRLLRPYASAASRCSARADKRAVRALNADLGEAVGALYVERFFPASSKAAGARAGREPARLLRGAHPDAALDDAGDARRWRWRSSRRSTPSSAIRTSGATTRHSRSCAGTPSATACAPRMFEWQRQVKRLGEPTDRSEWGMTPQTINAYYNPTFNEVVFPAAILQPPFFDPHADPAVNYGGIGAVIGHEMGHGFDDQGSKSDARGVLRTWWDPADTAAFAAAHRRARDAVRRLHRAAGPERQRPPHARGEHRRSRRGLGGLRRLPPLAQRYARRRCATG